MFVACVRKGFIKLQVLAYTREGASGIEYAIVAAMCAVVIGAFMSPISTRVTAIFNLVQSSIASS